MKKRPPLLDVKIRSYQKTLFQGKLRAVSSQNDRGPFDVLPQHANFISLIKKEIILHQPNKTKKTLRIDSGLLQVWENQVSIYLKVDTPDMLRNIPGVSVANFQANV